MYIDSQQKTPLVTVIMPAYNAGPYVEEAIASVVGQSVQDWELLVIDDGSADDTVQTVTQLAQADPRIRLVVNRQNIGVAGTRNRGLSLCRGRYVALLDSDDYWKPCFLEKMIARAEETEADIIYCAYEIVDMEGNPLCSDFLVPPVTNFEESIVRSVITCSTVLLTGKLARENRFPTDLYHEDIALWFRLLRDGVQAAGVTEVLASYRQHEGSRSHGKLTSARRRWTIYRKHLGMPFFKSVGVMARYGYYGLKKYKKI